MFAGGSLIQGILISVQGPSNFLIRSPLMDNNKLFTRNVIETVIKVTILGALVVWSFLLVKPFLVPVVWGGILAVATDPFITRVARMLGGRKSLAAILFVLVIIAALIIPSVVLVSSSIDTVQTLTVRIQKGTLAIPLPPASVADWPLIGESVYETWQLASTNLTEALGQFTPQIKNAIGPLLNSVGGGLVGLLTVMLSTFIAGFFLAKADPVAATVQKIVTRLAGDRGVEITTLATATIRGVMLGVVGVAIVQAVLATAGMLMVEVPAAGIWAILVLIFAVAQLPPILILGPVAAYVFSVSETTPAVLFLIWSIAVSASDGFLKPLLMGRGVNIPMPVILIGAIGGMMLSGIIGLFVGAVVLAIMYSLFMAWMDETEEVERAT